MLCLSEEQPDDANLPFTSGNGEDEEENEEEEEELSSDEEPMEPGILGEDHGEDEDEDEDEDEMDLDEDEDMELGDEDDEFDEDEGEDDEDVEEKPSGPPRGPAAKFLEGEKGASFAKAFSKILDHKVKQRPVDGEEDPTLILAESRSVAKRKAEEQEAAKASRASKKMRLDMKNRGHVKILQKGLDTTSDLKEKQLSRIATRGVVMLFNAISQAQKKVAGAEGSAGGSKAAKLSKASFLAQLKGLGPSGTEGQVLGLAKSKKQDGAKVGAGWLAKDFTGLGNLGSKMKDFDKQGGEDEEEKVQMNSDDEDDEGW